MKNASSTKRFMAPSGGSVNVPSSSSQQPASNFSQSATLPNTRVSLSHGRQHPQIQHSAPPSRYLITVLPPDQLPHDPPHPRTSTFCSGYGPPSKFRRGTLVPLHSTLAGQMAAIAREYGLPSTGGIALYLVELNQEQQNPLGDALVGGPRIGDEAWQLLWGQLFVPPQDDYEVSMSDEDERDFDQYAQDQHSCSIPAMPPLPPSMKFAQRTYGPHESPTLLNTSENRPASPNDPQSDVSSLADNSSALTSEDLLGHHSIVSSNTSHIFSPDMRSIHQTKSSNTSHNQDFNDSIPSSPHARPYSSASRGRPRNLTKGQSRRASNLNARPNVSRHSVRSNRSYSLSNTSAEGPLFGEAVVVGKIEFDIDNRRGAGKWFDAWVQSANMQPSGSTSPIEQMHSTTRHVMPRQLSTVSNAGSLLRERNLVSELEAPSSTGPVSVAESTAEYSRPPPSSEQSCSVVEAEVGDEHATAAHIGSPQAHLVIRDSMSSVDSRVTPSVLSTSELPAESTPQQVRPDSSQPEYTFNLDNTDSYSLADRPALDGSKRSSQASHASLLSPAQVPISQRSSHDLASWQTTLSRSNGSPQLASERSSSSSFGHEANIEAMNATPRVRAPPLFTTRSVSPSPSDSASPPPHSPMDIDASINSSARQSGVHDPEQYSIQQEAVSLQRQSAFSEDDPQSRPQSTLSSGGASHRASVHSQSHYHEPADEERTELQDAPIRTVELSPGRSSVSTSSRHSSSSFDAVSMDESGYQALADDEGAVEIPSTTSARSISRTSSHQPVESSNVPSTSEAGDEDSQYVESEVNEVRSPIDHDDADIDLSKSDPLRDVFPNDANTWAQIKYSHDNPEDSAIDSPAEELVQTALGLGISSNSMLHTHTIPASASSSLDPFEYDDEARDTLNSPIGPPENDVKEVTELLKANSTPMHFGLSSPINLGEPSKRLSAQSQPSTGSAIDTDVEATKPANATSPTGSLGSMASIKPPSPSRALSFVDPALIALPESDSNLSLSTLAPSTSAKSLASMASQPSIWEPENTLTEAPKFTNRDARLPFDWADQLSAMGNLRSRGNSVNTDDREDETGSDMPVGELPQFLSQFGDGPQSRASLASLYAQSARSRSSSVEMMDNLDEIERALAELSPRALKTTLGDNGQNAPNLAAFLLQSGPLGSVPGYGKDSVHEKLAASSPRATLTDNTSIRQSLEHDDAQSAANVPDETLLSKDKPAANERTLLAGSQSTDSMQSHDSEYMRPPLPLKIRSDRSAPSSPAMLSHDLGEPTPIAYTVDLPKVGTPTREISQEQQITSPGGESLASTAIPYDAPSVANSPQQRVTFNLERQETQESPNTPTPKHGMSSKFAAGLKLKGWSGKNSQKESTPPVVNTKEASSPAQSEKVKPPLPGLKGFKWWQKEGPPHPDESVQKLAAQTSLPASPSTPQQADVPTSILSKPNPPFSQTARIPRKSSLASLAATARAQESLSPNMQNVHSMSLSSTSPASMTSPHFAGVEYPSPPTHTSLPSPSRRPIQLPSFMPSYPPQFIVDDEDRSQSTPSLIRNNSTTPQSSTAGLSPQTGSQSLTASSAMVASASLPMLSETRSGPNGDYLTYLQRTPELGSNPHGVFLGHEGGNDGHTTSAPTTPASAIPSLVPSSGRYGKPSKANPVKANFRLSADSDLSKMMKHMQAIEFGEESAQMPEQGHHHPARSAPVPRGTFGLGLGLPGSRKVTR